MLIWPKHVTVGLCCLISCDGTISFRMPKDNKKNYDGIGKSEIFIFHSVEVDWVKQIKKVLLEHKIGVSIRGPLKRDPNKANLRTIDNKIKDMYCLSLNRRYPKLQKRGLNQYQVFRNSIEYWGVQDYLIKRKYDNLCKFTKLMALIGSPKMQSSIF